jgi:hypothetical protein
MQVPFWILVVIIILLPAINSIIIGYAVNLDLIVAFLIIPFIAGMIVACFYLHPAVKALQVVKRSERLNVDKKSRVFPNLEPRIDHRFNNHCVHLSSVQFLLALLHSIGKFVPRTCRSLRRVTVLRPCRLHSSLVHARQVSWPVNQHRIS